MGWIGSRYRRPEVALQSEDSEKEKKGAGWWEWKTTKQAPEALLK
jgi:uncharacterized protein YcaQ